MEEHDIECEKLSGKYKRFETLCVTTGPDCLVNTDLYQYRWKIPLFACKQVFFAD